MNSITIFAISKSKLQNLKTDHAGKMHSNPKGKFLNRFVPLFAPVLIAGCASVVNTAGSGEYACPGMPTGVVCKTPAAVYKSTNGDPTVTDFDTPIGSQSVAALDATFAPSPSSTAATLLNQPVVSSTKVLARPTPGPKPVREPAKVLRVWIAPWVDKNDNLHLAQILYTEVTPRTWSVGKSEVSAGRGYVIPHLAFTGIETDGRPGAVTPVAQPQVMAPPDSSGNRGQVNDGFPALPGQ